MEIPDKQLKHNLPTSRFVFIDALRGIAALLVLFHHMLGNTVMASPLSRVLPEFISKPIPYGSHGVQIFFIISGFVIAHSLRHNPLTGQSIGNFILRRQIRLDPPYWAILLVALLLHKAETLMPLAATRPMPTATEFLAHFFYLQYFAHITSELPVAWTLCIEIQLYLVFIALLKIGSLLDKPAGSRKSLPFSTALVFGLGVVSLLLVPATIPYSYVFIHYWFYFASGVLCYWCLQSSAPQAVFYSFVALCSAALLATCLPTLSYKADPGIQAGMIFGLVTVNVLYLVGRCRHLTDWLDNRVLQYLGRISYSLYLVHLPIVDTVLRLAYKITGENEMFSLIWVTLTFALCLGAAHIFYLFVERPSMNWAAKFKQKDEGSRQERFEESESGFAAENDKSDGPVRQAV